MKIGFSTFLLLFFCFCSSVKASETSVPDSLDKIYSPVVVGTLPIDAFNGLVRLGDGEIRHYGGPGFIYSRDNGLTWSSYRFGQKDSDGKVKRGGVAGSFSPDTGTYLRVQGGKDGLFVHRSTEGIDGNPTRVKVDDRHLIMIRRHFF